MIWVFKWNLIEKVTAVYPYKMFRKSQLNSIPRKFNYDRCDRCDFIVVETKYLIFFSEVTIENG